MNALFPFLAAGNPITDILTQFGVNWQTFIPQVVNFALVAAALYWFAFRPVLKSMDERNAKIESGLKFADEMKQKLAEADKQYEARLVAAADESAKIAGEANARAKIFEEKAAQEAIAKANDILRRADEQLKRDREKMLLELRGEVARLVVETAGKVLAKELSPDEKSRFNTAAAGEIAAKN